MKNIFIYLLSIGFTFSLLACDNNDEEKQPLVLPDATGTYTDERDGNEYGWIRYGDLEWMVENMRYQADEGYCEVYIPSDLTDKEYDIVRERNYTKYGYLYDIPAALSVVPEGWRLPTDEDWQALEAKLGISSSELGNKGWRGDKEGEIARQVDFLHLQAGGFYDCATGSWGDKVYKPYNISVCGMYWSSSKDEAKTTDSYIYREVRYNSGQICRNSTLKDKLMSVRCVRDVLK